MTLHIVLMLLYIMTSLAGLFGCVLNVKHAESDCSPVPRQAGYYCKGLRLYFFGMSGIALTTAAGITGLAPPNATGIGSWMFLWFNLCLAGESLLRAFRNQRAMKEEMANLRGFEYRH